MWLRDEPQFAARLIYPGIELSEDEGRFPIGQAIYQLTYSKGRVSSEDYGDTTCQTTRGTLTLKVNGESVFEFEADETVVYAPESPSFGHSLGEITRFIEGPWFTELVEFVSKLDVHEHHAWKERNAPKEAQEAEDLRKRFGL